MDLIKGTNTDLNLVCRTCLNESNDMKSIFMNDGKANICKMLKSCSGLNIQPFDELPTKICATCLNKVHISYEFRQQCEITHNTLVNFISDHPNETYETKLEDDNLLLIINGGNACEVLMDLVCRTCLNESNNMKSIFMNDGNDISKMLQYCSGLNIPIMEGSPKKICSDCLKKLRISYEFRRQCELLLNFMGTLMNREPESESESRSETPPTKKIKGNASDMLEKDCSSNTIEMNGDKKNNISAEPNDGGEESGIECDNTIGNGMLICDKNDDPIINATPIVIFESDVDFKHDDFLILETHLQDSNNLMQQQPKALVEPIQTKTEICKICQKVFAAMRNLKIHMKLKHKELYSIISEECEGSALPTLSSLTEQTCKLCQKSFATMKSVKIHMKHKHKEHFSIINGECEGSVLPTLSPLTEQTCKFCQKSFATMKSVKIHMKHKHKEHFSIINGECEGPVLPTLSPLTKQTCKFCQKSFATMKSVKRHMKRKHKEHFSIINEECEGPVLPTLSPFKKQTCELCQKSFATMKSVKIHMKHKHKEHFSILNEECEGSELSTLSPFTEQTCKHCQRSFATMKSLRIHMKLGHRELIKNGIFPYIRKPKLKTKVEIESGSETIQTDSKGPIKYNESFEPKLEDASLHKINGDEKDRSSSSLIEIKIEPDDGDEESGIECDKTNGNRMQSCDKTENPITDETPIIVCKSKSSSSDDKQDTSLIVETRIGTRNVIRLQQSKINGQAERFVEPIPSKSETCEICQKSFVALRNLKIHMKLKHLMQYTKINGQGERTVEHTTSKIEICEICQKSFLTLRCLRIHKKRAHKDKNHFKINRRVDRFVKPTKTETTICRICKRVFAASKNLKIHMKLAHRVELVRKRIFKDAHNTKSRRS